MPLCYTLAETIDRLIITELKIWHTDNQKQLDSLDKLRIKCLEALEEKIPSEAVDTIAQLVYQHIEQWHLEEDMANPDISDEAKVDITDKIIELNRSRIKAVQAIDKALDSE